MKKTFLVVALGAAILAAQTPKATAGGCGNSCNNTVFAVLGGIVAGVAITEALQPHTVYASAPAPVYCPPPAPVYCPPPVVYAPAPVYCPPPVQVVYYRSPAVYGYGGYGYGPGRGHSNGRGHGYYARR